jgi:ribosomal protein L29
MKKNQKDQIRTMSIDELGKELSDTVKKLSDRAIGKKGSSTRNVREGKMLRIKRAILLTALREKELHV